MTVDSTPGRRRLMPAGLIVVLVIAIAVGVGVANGAFRGAGPAPASPSSSVPGLVPADQGVVAQGRAVPIRSVELQAAVPGTVAALPVHEGATVAAGATLLQLDSTAADADLAQAEAAAAAASAGVAQATASLAQAKAASTAADAGVDQAAAARRAAIAARDAIPSIASSATKRQAAAQVDEATAALASARATRIQARAAVDAAAAAVDAAKADEVRAKAAVDGAKAALAQLVIRAPFPGTVVSIEPVVGDRVQPGTPIVRIADVSAWRFETSDLSETSIARVRDGAAATVTVDGLPGVSIPGSVASVGTYGASVQGDITFRVVVAPTGSVPTGLRWNMTVTIEIAGAPAG